MEHENELSKRERILLVEYETTSAAWRYEGETYWSRYNVMFAISSALLALMGYVIVNRKEFDVALTSRFEDFVLVISIAGTIFSLVWFFTSARSAAFYRYWIKRLQKIEDDLQYPGTIRGIGDYFEAMTRWGFYTRVPVTTVSLAIPLSFLAAYLSINWLLFGMGCKEMLALIIQAMIIIGFVAWGLRAARKKTSTK